MDLKVINNEHSIQPLSNNGSDNINENPLKNLMRKMLFTQFTIGTDNNSHKDFINKSALPTQKSLKTLC